MDTPKFQTAPPLPCPTPTAPPTPPPPPPLPPAREVEDLLHAKAVTFLLGVRAQYLRGGASGRYGQVAWLRRYYPSLYTQLRRWMAEASLLT